MGDEQLINKVMKRIDATDEARRMFLSEWMMNRFLKGKGIEVK